jgi:hypothetical protein
MDFVAKTFQSLLRNIGEVSRGEKSQIRVYFVLSISFCEKEVCFLLCRRLPDVLWGDMWMTIRTLLEWHIAVHVSVFNYLPLALMFLTKQRTKMFEDLQ